MTHTNGGGTVCQYVRDIYILMLLAFSVALIHICTASQSWI